MSATRRNPFVAHFDLAKPLQDFAHAAREGLDPVLVELIDIRASQINGCAGCLVLHTRRARKAGETEERIYLLNAWRESPNHYSERERAALAWTEALTLLPRGGVPDAVHEQFAAHFSEEDQARITLVVGAINVFNRMNVGFGVQPPGPRPA